MGVGDGAEQKVQNTSVLMFLTLFRLNKCGMVFGAPSEKCSGEVLAWLHFV